MPNERRLTPAATNPARRSSSTVPGFASSVISTSPAMVSSRAAPSSRRAIVRGENASTNVERGRGSGTYAAEARATSSVLALFAAA